MKKVEGAELKGCTKAGSCGATLGMEAERGGYEGYISDKEWEIVRRYINAR